MTQKVRKPTATNTELAGSAPELPQDLAKQFGIHHTRPKAAKVPQSKGTAGSAAPKEASTPASASTLSADNTESLSVLDDDKTNAAVDDILTKESDELLAVQDRAYNAQPPVPPKRGFWRSIGHFFVAWWRNGWSRWLTILVILAAIAAFVTVPKIRYAVLNAVGVRSTASVTVLDNTTQLPLKNVEVTLGNEKKHTNKDGVAKFSNLKLGDSHVSVKRLAFAPAGQDVTIGWGSNPLGPYKLKATGIQYELSVFDYVSGKPFERAEVTSDEASAFSDHAGKVVLTVEDTDMPKLSVQISAPGYRTEQLELDVTKSATSQTYLVPTSKHVFVSKQSGTYDVIAMDIDGKNRKVVLAGTGSESSNISLVASPDNKRAALISTRDAMRDSGGSVMPALTIINLEDGTNVIVDHAQQIQFIDWQGDRLIYRATTATDSKEASKRNRLISYNYDNNSRVQLATANQFNTIISAKGAVYYGVSSNDPQASLGLFRVKPDGSDRKQLSDKEVWTGLRKTYNSLSLQTPEGWETLDLLTGEFQKSSAPDNIGTYLFADDAKAKHSVWLDKRDGQSALVLYDVAKDTAITLSAQDGISYPVRWIGDRAVVYRLSTGGETADYVISTDGGTPRKVSDVVATYGYAQSF